MMGSSLNFGKTERMGNMDKWQVFWTAVILVISIAAMGSCDS